MLTVSLDPKIVEAIEYVLNATPHRSWTCKLTKFDTAFWVEFLDGEENRQFLIEKDIQGSIYVVNKTIEPGAICIHVVDLLRCPLFDKNDMRVRA
jgi:hypothetical protein